MSCTNQFLALLRMNLTSLTRRLGLVLTIVVGITCAVGVLVSMLAMGVGARRQALGNVRADRVVLSSTGAQSTLQSSIPREAAFAIRDTPGIRKSPSGQPVALFETVVMIEARKRLGGARINFPLLGVSSGLTELRPEVHLTAGRLFHSGVHEIIASEGCARQYTGFAIGDRQSIRGGTWSVVGQFDLRRTQESCTLYADADSVMAAFGRDSYNQVSIMLESAAGYDAFVAALKANPALRIEAKHESEAVAETYKPFTGILNFTSYFIGTIMAVGATLGAVNSLYAIVDSRRRELATLLAIGFSPAPIVAAILSESIFLALPAAMLGAGLAWMFFDGLSASPFGVSLQLTVTPSLVALGIGWALVMGLVGGFGPALRAARVSVTTALRAT
jgi:putative ABC transport system permease protein